MAAGGAWARQRAGRDQRSGSTGRTLAATGVYARSVSFSLPMWRLHRPLFFILNEQRQRPTIDIESSEESVEVHLALLERQFTDGGTFLTGSAFDIAYATFYALVRYTRCRKGKTVALLQDFSRG
jgi:glutathione S-transferase